MICIIFMSLMCELILHSNKLKIMQNILIINGWHSFAASQGRFNKSLFDLTQAHFESTDDYLVRTTEIEKGYNVEEEVTKYLWADTIIYHTPIWWFYLPFKFKQYLDEVLTAGYGEDKGMWISDGRNQKNPEINYGTGGLLHGKNYVLTTSWNAPEGAFSLPDEFFKEISVDNGPMSGFHGMNRYLGLELLKSLKFYDVEKNADIKAQLRSYKEFLNKKFKVRLTSLDYEAH